MKQYVSQQKNDETCYFYGGAFKDLVNFIQYGDTRRRRHNCARSTIILWVVLTKKEIANLQTLSRESVRDIVKAIFDIIMSKIDVLSLIIEFDPSNLSIEQESLISNINFEYWHY